MIHTHVSDVKVPFLCLVCPLLSQLVVAREGSRPRYGDPAYWEETYKAGEGIEWLLPAAEFVPMVQPYLRLNDRLLQLGCGNSRVAETMATVGYTNLTSMDVSPTVIEENRKRYPPEDFPALQFLLGDVLTMSDFTNGSFDAALDKGTWDAIRTSSTAESRVMLHQVRRVLRPGGLYLVLTFGSPSLVLGTLLDSRIGWKVEGWTSVPNPLHDGVSRTLKDHYLYRCRNEDRGEDWVPPGDAPPEVASAIAEALEYERAISTFDRHEL